MLRRLSWLAVLALSASIGFASDEDSRQALRIEIENLALSGSLSSGVGIAAGDLLAEFYERRGFKPVWTHHQVAELLSVIESSYDDGLDPKDYHVDAVRVARRDLEANRLLDPVDQAVTDILLTESLIRLGYHERFGKVNPYALDSNWNFRRELGGLDPVAAIQEIMESPSLSDALRELFPRGEWYQGMRDALKEYLSTF